MSEKDSLKIHHFAVSEDHKIIHFFCLRGDEKLVIPMQADSLIKSLPTLEYIVKEINAAPNDKKNIINNGQPLEIEAVTAPANGAFSFIGKNTLGEKFHIAFMVDDSLKMMSSLQKIINKIPKNPNNIEIKSYIPLSNYRILLDESGGVGIILIDSDGIEYSFLFPQALALQFCTQVSGLVEQQGDNHRQ